MTTRRAQYLCAIGKVKGAQKLGHFWVVPKGTPKPIDGRTKVARQQKGV
ncbi:MAG: DNA-binding protein [Firmicutes bacterium]|nr:DNA-binding protein [Bacillota bacterium]